MSAIPKYSFSIVDLVNKGWTTQANIEAVRGSLLQNSKIPPISDEQIVLFLVACNNSIADTKLTIENHFRIKSGSPHIFCGRNIENDGIKQAISAAYITPGPKRTKEDYLIVFGSLKNTSYQAFVLDNLVRHSDAAIEVSLQSSVPKGIIFVLNLKGFGIMHLTRLKINTVRAFLAYVQEALPAQLKAVHVLNANYIFEKVLSILRPFMKKELYDMIRAHPVGMKMEEFFENCVPADCMPVDYEGKLQSLEKMCEDFYDRWRETGEFLEAEERQMLAYEKN